MSLIRTSALRRTVAPVVVALAGSLALGACSGSSAEKEEAACDSYATFADAVSQLDTLDKSSSVDEINAVRDDVATAYEDFRADLDEVAEDRAEALEDAWTEFRKAVDDIDGDATVPEAAASLQEEVSAIQSARAEAAEELSCS